MEETGKIGKFILFETIIFLIIGGITLLEIAKFNIFETFFTYIKTPASWFVGLSLAYAFSNFIQKTAFAYFRRNIEQSREKDDFFVGFIFTLIITSMITPFIKSGAIYFFSNFFAYFHLIIMQSIIMLYLLFKLKGNYEISGKHFLTNQLMVIFYTIIILYFI